MSVRKHVSDSISYSKTLRVGRKLGLDVCLEDMIVVLRNAGYVDRGPFG